MLSSCNDSGNAVLSFVGAVLAAGASTPGSNSSSASERPTYTHVAALQELALVLVPAEGHMQMFSADDLGERRHHRRHTLSAGSSSNSTGSSSNASHGTQGGTNATASSANSSSSTPGRHQKAPNSMRTVVTPSAAAAQSAAPVANNSSDVGRRTTLDLDPPFRPLVDRYFALLPPGPSVGQLVLSSSRWGDVVVVDTTACSELESTRCEHGHNSSLVCTTRVLHVA